MKIAPLALATILLVTVLHVERGDAWPRIRIRWPRIRLPRIRIPPVVRNILKKVVCPTVCRTVCSEPVSCTLVCGAASHKLCRRRKRDALAQEERPFPAQFDSYDDDRDGFISRPEFAKTLQSNEFGSKEAFDLSDTNADGLIDNAEFATAPLSATGKLNGQDAAQDVGYENQKVSEEK